MPYNPHWYSVRREWEHDEEFVYFVEYIRKHGYDGVFGKRVFKYLNINGYKYWTMGAPINLDGKHHTIILNRDRIKYDTDYDKIAVSYDTLFTDEASLFEDAEVIELCKPTGKVLDIGCGTGLLLDHVQTENYTGIDMSKGMLEVLKKKHPDANVINTTLEDFYPVEKFDTIVSLYGTPSYIPYKESMRMLKMLSPKGKIFLMYYDNDYFPVTHKALGINTKIYKHDLSVYEKFNNYRLVKKQYK